MGGGRKGTGRKVSFPPSPLQPRCQLRNAGLHFSSWVQPKDLRLESNVQANSSRGPNSAQPTGGTARIPVRCHTSVWFAGPNLYDSHTHTPRPLLTPSLPPRNCLYYPNSAFLEGPTQSYLLQEASTHTAHLPISFLLGHPQKLFPTLNIYIFYYLLSVQHRTWDIVGAQ